MTPDVDPYQAQWSLRPKVEALRAEAAALRTKNWEHYRAQETELGLQRDRLTREHDGLEQQAKSADSQVATETKEVERITTGLAKREAAMAEAEKRGDHAKAQEDSEDIAGWRVQLTTHEARARQATLDAAELREQAAAIDRRRTELSVERGDMANRSGKVEGELDKMERQADLMNEARLKYGEADMAKDDIPRRAALELEAEALVRQAEAVQVDRDAIRLVVPDLPRSTPGYDADPGPLPAGTGDETSSMGEPTDGTTEQTTDETTDHDAAATETSSDDDVLGVDATAGTESVAAPTDELGAVAGDTAPGADEFAADGASTDYASTDYASTDYASTDDASTDFGSTDYASTDDAPTDYASTDYASADYASDFGSEFAAPAQEADTGFADPNTFETELFAG